MSAMETKAKMAQGISKTHERTVETQQTMDPIQSFFSSAKRFQTPDILMALLLLKQEGQFSIITLT